ncbi:hypothetical protein XENOCAPTIV_016330, partial [Xenoophorus captivus]
ASRWSIPAVFSWLHKEGCLSDEEMTRTFNCGLGAVLVVAPPDAQRVLRQLQVHDEAWIVGSLAHKQPGSQEGISGWDPNTGTSDKNLQLQSCSIFTAMYWLDVICALTLAPNQVVDHKLYGSRAEFDGTIDRVLEESGVELVCLAGFMRILTGTFVKKWTGIKMLFYVQLKPDIYTHCFS